MNKDIFDLAAGENADHMRSLDRKQYHREKAAESREMWAGMGVRQISVACHEDAASYVKALVTLDTAVRIYNAVEARDPTVIDTLSNIRPRYVVTYIQLRQMRDRTEGEDAQAALTHLMWASQQALDARHKGYHEDTNSEEVGYYLAREFALVKYIKGAYDMLMFNITSRSFAGLQIAIPETDNVL